MRDVGVVVTKLHVIQYYSNQKKNDKEEGKFFPKAVPFFRPDEKIGVGEKKGGGGSCCRVNSKYHDAVNKALDTVMQYT